MPGASGLEACGASGLLVGLTKVTCWRPAVDFAPKAGQPERLWVCVESVNGEHCTGRLEQSGRAAGLPLSGDLLAFENRHIVNSQVIPQPASA